MLKIKHLYFSYGKKEILKNIDLQLTGGIGCLLGPNGAGKSTLLKCIAGILNPKAGEIQLNKRGIEKLNFKERAKFVSYAPQEFSVNFPYTVFEIVLMGRNPHINILEGPKKEDIEETKKAIQTLKLAKFENIPFTSLSGGEKRLTLIARALSQNGQLMLFDEPTSFLDFRNQLIVLTVINKIAKRFKKLVLVSLHDPNLALSFCDKVFLLKEGTILKNGNTDEVITEENIDLLYSLKSRLVKLGNKRFIIPEKLL